MSTRVTLNTPINQTIDVLTNVDFVWDSQSNNVVVTYDRGDDNNGNFILHEGKELTIVGAQYTNFAATLEATIRDAILDKLATVNGGTVS